MFQKHQLKMLKILIQTVCYSGKEEEGLTETRVRLYKQMETKSFQFLPPDEKSILQAIKLIQFEVYYWSRVDEAIINVFAARYCLDCQQRERRCLSIMIHWYVFNFIFAFP